MTNFIYNMQDELFHLNMILPVGEFSPIKKLVDHIEAQGKQLRELNAAITKRNSTIEKYEREKKELQSSEQAIGALQKKCQEYKNSESDAITSTIETLVKENKGLEEKNKKLEHDYNELIKQRNGLYYENKKLERANLDLGDTIGLYVEEFKKIKEKNKTIEKSCREADKALEDERQINKDLNTIINSKNKLLDEYMAKCNNLERNYAVLRGKLVSIGQLVNKIDDVILSEE